MRVPIFFTMRDFYMPPARSIASRNTKDVTFNGSALNEHPRIQLENVVFSSMVLIYSPKLSPRRLALLLCLVRTQSQKTFKYETYKENCHVLFWDIPSIRCSFLIIHALKPQIFGQGSTIAIIIKHNRLRPEDEFKASLWLQSKTMSHKTQANKTKNKVRKETNRKLSASPPTLQG